MDSCFNDCILLFSDLPDIVIETCVVESQKMYLSTPQSVTFRKHVLREVEPNEFVSGGNWSAANSHFNGRIQPSRVPLEYMVYFGWRTMEKY